jgi:molybdenum cofactor cytidylyltransferase
MIFGALPLADAEGAVLAHAVTLGGRRIAKGTTVDRGLAQAAAAAGLERLWVARAEPGDVPEDAAAGRIAGALAGPGVVRQAPANGRVNLVATAGGLLSFEPGAIDRANGLDEAVAVSALPPLTPVAPGALVATVKIIPFAVPGRLVAAAIAALAPIGVRPWRPGLTARLLQSRHATTGAKVLEKTAAVTRERLGRLGIALAEAAPVAHTTDALAESLRAGHEPLLLVAGATATSDRRDVVPAAIAAAGGTVLRVGMPVDPGNLLVLGALGDAMVLGLPGCARSPKRNGLDLVLERFAAGLPVTADAIGGMGVGGLFEGSGAAVPWGWR